MTRPGDVSDHPSYEVIEIFTRNPHDANASSSRRRGDSGNNVRI